MMEGFVWPSDRARAENPELNRICEYLEDVLDEQETARAQCGQGAEPVGFIPSSGLNNLAAGHPAKIYPVDATPSPFESHELIYTQPQPAVPEETEAMVDAAIKVFEDAGAKVDLGWLGEACRAYVRASFTTPKQSAAKVPEGWTIRRQEDGRIYFSAPSGARGAFERRLPKDDEPISATTLDRAFFDLCSDLLSTPTTPQADGCEWHTDGNGCWKGACGKEFWFEDGGPFDNGMKYCLSCGKPCIDVGDPDEQSGGQDNAL